MVQITTGSIFNAATQALVNPVNCVGVMGAGLALQFKQRYPYMFTEYRRLCQARSLRPGVISVHKGEGKLIICFPTKLHWRNPARLEYVEAGLQQIPAIVEQHRIKSIAFPKLGTGLGGLDWSEVEPLMIQYLTPIPISILIYT